MKIRPIQHVLFLISPICNRGYAIGNYFREYIVYCICMKGTMKGSVTA